MWGPSVTLVIVDAMQHQELAKLFQNLESLDLRQPTKAAFDDYQSRFQQLAALTRLTSLKVHWDWSWGSFALSQVQATASTPGLQDTGSPSVRQLKFSGFLCRWLRD